MPLALLLLLSQAQQAPGAGPVDIVVVARRRSCRVQLGGTVLSDRTLDRYAGEWASGRGVRILAPADADYRCLAKIMFRLSDRGVRNATFVDPLTPPPSPAPSTAATRR